MLSGNHIHFGIWGNIFVFCIVKTDVIKDFVVYVF